MKRPVGVVLTAIVQILGSLFVLLFSVFTLFIPGIMRNAPTSTPPPAMPPGLLFGTAALYGIFAVLGFLTAIGLFRMRNWARYSTLIFGGFLAVVGIITALVLAVMPMPAPTARSEELPQHAMTMIRVIMTLFSLSLAALGTIWLYYFNRTSTKAAFAGVGGSSGLAIGGRRVPVSIFVIALMNLLGAAYMLVMALWIPANMFFGIIVTGAAAKALTLAMGLAALYMAIGLLRLSNAARLFSIAMQFFYVINAVVMVFLPIRFEQYMQKIQSGWTNAVSAPLPSYMRSIFLIAGIVPLIITYFLVTRANAFRHETRSEIAAM